MIKNKVFHLKTFSVFIGFISLSSGAELYSSLLSMLNSNVVDPTIWIEWFLPNTTASATGKSH